MKSSTFILVKLQLIFEIHVLFVQSISTTTNVTIGNDANKKEATNVLAEIVPQPVGQQIQPVLNSFQPCHIGCSKYLHRKKNLKKSPSQGYPVMPLVPELKNLSPDIVQSSFVLTRVSTHMCHYNTINSRNQLY